MNGFYLGFVFYYIGENIFDLIGKIKSVNFSREIWLWWNFVMFGSGIYRGCFVFVSECSFVVVVVIVISIGNFFVFGKRNFIFVIFVIF